MLCQSVFKRQPTAFPLTLDIRRIFFARQTCIPGADARIAVVPGSVYRGKIDGFAFNGRPVAGTILLNLYFAHTTGCAFPIAV
jgi:hypothetical protein